MADKIVVEPLDPNETDKDKVAAHNERVLQQQKDQDISGQPVGGPQGIEDAGSALDRLKNSVVKDENGETPGEKAERERQEQEAAEAEKKKQQSETPEEKEARETKEREAAEAAAADEARRKADDARAEALFKDAPALPANASPKSSEAFSSIKQRAAQEIGTRDAKIEELTKTVADLTEKTKNPVPPEVETELKELREFRAKLDVQTDPQFKKFDEQISQAHEFVYAQLLRSPQITKDMIEEIKKLGGPENVKMENLFEAIKDPMIQRLVEAKLADSELLRYNKQQAINQAQGNVGEYLKQKSQEWEKVATSHNSRTAEVMKELSAKIPWLKPVTVDPKAKEEDRKSAEAHNEYLKQVNAELDSALRDDSPDMRATLLIGMAQLFRLQTVHEVATKKIATLEKELETANGTITRMKKSSTSRLTDSGAPVTPATKASSKSPNEFTETAAEALERIRQAKIQEQQNRS